MKVKTKDLNGRALDWAVMFIELKRLQEKGEYIKPWVLERHTGGSPCGAPSVLWSQCGPIIEREGLNLQTSLGEWVASTPKAVEIDGGRKYCFASGHSLPIAAMRCYVLSRLGDTVDIPDNLIGVNQVLEK